jgi:hypothetical protein
MEQRFPSHTYLLLEAEWLKSKGSRSVGTFEYTDRPPFVAVPSSTREELHFDEKALALSVHQLIGPEWALGSRYRVSRAELESEFTMLPQAVIPDAEQDQQATLHELLLFAIWQNAAGFFARGETTWHAQDQRGDDFWQLNVLGGYRFGRRRAEIAIGLVNLTDQDYRLNPLNAIVEIPHERVFVATFKFNF